MLCQTSYRWGWLLTLMLLPLKCWHYCRPGPPLIWAWRLVPNFTLVLTLGHWSLWGLFVFETDSHCVSQAGLLVSEFKQSSYPTLPRDWNYKAHTIAKRGAIILMCLSSSGISLFCVWLSSCSSTTRDGVSTSQIWHSQDGFIPTHLTGFFGLDAQYRFTLFWLP